MVKRVFDGSDRMLSYLRHAARTRCLRLVDAPLPIKERAQNAVVPLRSTSVDSASAGENELCEGVLEDGKDKWDCVVGVLLNWRKLFAQQRRNSSHNATFSPLICGSGGRNRKQLHARAAFTVAEGLGGHRRVHSLELTRLQHMLALSLYGRELQTANIHSQL